MTSPRSTLVLRSRSANESKNGWIWSVQYASLASLNTGAFLMNLLIPVSTVRHSPPRRNAHLQNMYRNTGLSPLCPLHSNASHPLSFFFPPPIKPPSKPVDLLSDADGRELGPLGVARNGAPYAVKVPIWARDDHSRWSWRLLPEVSEAERGAGTGGGDALDKRLVQVMPFRRAQLGVLSVFGALASA